MSDTQQDCCKASTWSKKKQQHNGQSQEAKPKRPRLKRSHLFPQTKSQLSGGKENTKTESPASEEVKEIPSSSCESPALKMESSGSVCDAEQPPCSSVEKEDSSYEPEMPQSNRECTVLPVEESPALEELKEIPLPSCVSPAMMMESSGSVCSGDAEQPPCSSVENEDSSCEPEMPQSSGEFTVLLPEITTPAAVRSGLKRKHSGSDAEQPPCKRFKKEEIELLVKALEELRLEDIVETHPETSGSPASEGMTQSPSAVKARSGRKRKTPLSACSSFEPRCKRAKLHQG